MKTVAPFPVRLSLESTETIRNNKVFFFSSLCDPETEIPVWEVEAGRNKADQRLQVCMEGRVRASEELPLLEGQSEGGTKAFISSQSVCVISINIPD